MFYNKIKTIAIITIALISGLVILGGGLTANAMTTLTEEELFNIAFNEQFNKNFNDAYNAKFNSDFDAAFNDNFNTQFNIEWLINNPRDILAN